MTKLEEALYVKWISRFGRRKIKELAEGIDAGKSIVERSEAIVKSSTEEELRTLLLQGFDGFFHQTVYIRRLPKAKASVDAIRNITVGGLPVDAVVLEDRTDIAKSEVGGLLMVSKTMEFLEQEGKLFSSEIPFPIAIKVSGDSLIVQVLTMQITVETWGGILEKSLRRMLAIVQADELSDQVLNFLGKQKVDVGEYVDYSKSAISLMKKRCIDRTSPFSNKPRPNTRGCINRADH